MFKFNLGEKVKDTVTGIVGTVIARAEYLYSENMYCIRYKIDNQNPNEEWVYEKQIEELGE